MSSSVASPSDDAAASPRGAVAGAPPGTPAVGSVLSRLTMLFRAAPRSWIVRSTTLCKETLENLAASPSF
eukprot:12536857-Alexandrium_andersonii.AAC.1